MRRPLPSRLSLLIAALLPVWGCRYITTHVPAFCARPTLDTTAVVTNAAGDTIALQLQPGCAVWQALDDSTKRWDDAGRRLRGDR